MGHRSAAGQATPPYRWAHLGDVNAFFGLMLDNVAVMVLLVGLICTSTPPADQQPGNFQFTTGFVLTRMIPGTAIGVLLGDLVYTWMAFRLAKRAGRSDVTGMPLGLDTPSTFGVALLVLLPALNEGHTRHGLDHDDAMTFAWHVGVLVLVLIGLFKVVCAPLGNAVRRWVPRAGLLGSLAAIALALIAFLPLLFDIAAVPLVGLLSLTVILVTLVAHRTLPGKVPGALAAVGVGIVVYFICDGLGQAFGWPLVPGQETPPKVEWEPPGLLPAFAWGADWWERVWWAALGKLPVALPFALATIIGGIDCTESAAAAGDEYDTRTILLTEGVASVAAGLCGGVIQNTPYIGHPAYKAMGGRAAYTLATALFVGAAGYFGWFTYLFEWLPRAAMFPILVYVGLEITGQSFRATPVKHYAALALAVLPALAYLATIPLKAALGPERQPHPTGAAMTQTLFCLANGFIVTSLLWAAALAALLDGRLKRSAGYLAVAGVCALFGIIHSPLPDTLIAPPGEVVERLEQPSRRAAGSAAAVCALVGTGNAPLPAAVNTLPEDQRPPLPADVHFPLPPAVRYQTPYHWAGTYALMAALLFGLALFGPRKPDEEPAERDKNE